MNQIIISACLFLFVPSFGFSNPTDQCNATYSERSLVISKIENLNDIVNVWKKHRPCLDGESAEAYSVAVSSVLDKKWDQVMKSEQLKSKDGLNAISFGISDVWSKEVSMRIYSNAKNKCSALAKKLCDDIVKSSPKATGASDTEK